MKSHSTVRKGLSFPRATALAAPYFLFPCPVDKVIHTLLICPKAFFFLC